MSDPIYNVLFLCTGNSARSILAETYLNHRGGGKFRAYSAGSHPTGRVNPMVLDLLQRCGIPIGGLRSKSWEEFAAPLGPPMDFVFTVCDRAAGEVCPVWPGSPVTGHWGVPDPAAAQGTDSEKMRAAEDVLRMVERRIDLFMCLPFGGLDRLSLRERVRQIGES